LKGKTLQLFEQVGAFNTDEELPIEGEDLFDFKIAKDVKSSYPKLFSILGEDFPERHLQSALEGNVKGLNLFKKRDKPYNIGSELAKCTRCELRTECKKPVYPSTSRNNLLLCGESPFKDEAKEGKPFVGKVSKILWDTLAMFDLNRNDFYVTNSCKCPPLLSKNPKAEHVLACRPWLEKEIENVRPFLILSLGQWARFSLIGEEQGILKANGTIVWSEEFLCWIVFAAHPGYVNRNMSFKGEFEDAIRLFSDKISNLGGI
jgi:DNA polymerase